MKKKWHVAVRPPKISKLSHTVTCIGNAPDPSSNEVTSEDILIEQMRTGVSEIDKEWVSSHFFRFVDLDYGWPVYEWDYISNGGRGVIEELKVNTTLKSLYLGGIRSFSGLENLPEALKVNTTLTALDLEGNQVDPAGCVVIGEALKASTSLTELGLGSNKLEAAGVQTLGEALKASTVLKKLSLSYNKVSVYTIAEVVKENTSLKELNLSGDEMGDAGAQAVAEALKVNSSVTLLNLIYNQIRDAGTQALAEALKVNTSITRLDLGSNLFGPAGVQALVGALKINATLTSLEGSNDDSVTKLLSLNSDLGPEAVPLILSPSTLRESLSGPAPVSPSKLSGSLPNAIVRAGASSLSQGLVKIVFDGLNVDSAILATLLQIPTLRVISVAGNPLIDTLPKAAPSKELALLDISHCSITCIPDVYHTVDFVLFAGNADISNPPREVCALGWGEMKRYLAEVSSSGARKNGQVKLFLTGLGEAGKTTLLRALMSADDRAPVKIGKDDRTFGVDVTEWEVSGTRDPMKLVVSDFAGQKVYYVTHQFFMTARGVYMLIMRPFRSERAGEVVRRAPDAVCEECKKGFNTDDSRVYHLEGRGLVHAGCFDYSEMVGDWLRRIYFRVPGAHVVPVVTRCDDGVADLPEQLGRIKTEIDRTLELLRQDVSMALKRLEGEAGSTADSNARLRLKRLRVLQQAPLRVSEPTAVDSMTGTGIGTLRRALVSAVEDLPTYGEVVPASYVKLAAEVVALRKQRKERGVSVPWAEYEALCHSQGLDQDFKVNLATKFLHATGVLLHFDGLGDMVKDMVFPDPSAVADMMKAIVSHDHLKGGVGVTAAIRLHVTALVRRGVLDHGTLLPFLFRSNAILPEEDLADPSRVDALAAVLREFGIMFQDDDYVRRTGLQRSIVPCMASRTVAPASSSSSTLASPPPMTATITYALLPEGFIFRLIAAYVRPRQTVLFSGTSADFVLHGRHTSVVVREEHSSSGGSTVVTVTAQRKSDLSSVLSGLEAAEKFFEGLARHASSVPDLGANPVDLIVVPSGGGMDLIRSLELQPGEVSEESGVPSTAIGAVVELSADFLKDPVVPESLRALRERGLPVVVVRNDRYRPDFTARAKNSKGEEVQRIWPAMPTPELDALAADVMGGQILRGLEKEEELIEDDICSLVAAASASGALANRAALPPGHHIPRFPRVVPEDEFGRLMACVEAVAERDLAQQWFVLQDGFWRLRSVASVLPAFADGSDPEGSAKAETEWRRVCEELLRVLGQAASRAFPGEANRDVRSRYLTGFDVPCPDCMDAGVSNPHLFSRDDAVLSWRTDRDKKTLPCSHGHNALLERILRPDCFLSYSWGPWNEDPETSFPTQKLVQRVKHGIEHSTATEEMPGMMCWFDLERMKGDSQQAMKDGVEQSGLVVIFLDLAYLRSAACNTELSAARQKGKHIVPIVLPGLVEDLKVNTDPKIAESARFLMPTEASDANVSVPLFVSAADPIEERAAKISSHVVEAILRRSCRDTLLSATGFAKRGVLATRAKSIKHALRFLANPEPEAVTKAEPAAPEPVPEPVPDPAPAPPAAMPLKTTPDLSALVALIARKDEELAAMRAKADAGASLEAQIKVKDEKLASSERQIALLKTALGTTETHVSDLRQQVSDLRQQVDDLRARAAAAEAKAASGPASPSATPSDDRPLSARSIRPPSASAARRIFPHQAHQPALRLAPLQGRAVPSPPQSKK
jgi:hypothetical protein